MLNIKKILKGLRILNDADQSKAVEVTVSNSATTNTKTTVVATQTANRTVTLPDDDATLVGDDTTQSLTNKQVSLSNTTDNKLLLSEATTHKIVDSGITHVNTLGDVALSSAGSVSFTLPLTKDHTFIGKSLIVPITSFNPLSPPSGTQGGVVFNTFDNIAYVNNGTTYIPLVSPVTSVNGQTGSVVLDTDDVSEGVANLYFTNSRAQSALVSDLALKANQSLNNLTTTSINQSLLPSTDASFNLGSTLLKWSSIFANFFKGRGYSIQDVSGVEVGKYEYFVGTSPSGSSASNRLISTSGNILVQSTNDATADAAPTGNILIESGNKLAGTGNSGDISLKTGTSLAGSVGSLKLDAPVQIQYNNGVEVLKEYVLPNTVLSASVTNNVISSITFPLNTYKAAQFQYRVLAVDTGNYRTGSIMIAIDGFNVNAGLNDAYAEAIPMPISFSVGLTGSDIEIRQTNTLTGFIYLSGKFTMIKG